MSERPDDREKHAAAGWDLAPEQIAQVCHEANRALQRIAGDPALSPPWDEAPDWQRDPAVAGVRAALDSPWPDPASHHETWCEAKRAAGWAYGPVKDPDQRTHPGLVPYEQLPGMDQAKNVVFLSIVRALASGAGG